MKKYLLILMIIPIWTSCTKEIDLDLDTADPKLVVEALLTDELKPFEVKLTQTSPYFSQGENYVSDAVVIITNSLGDVDTLSYTSMGKYSTLTNRQTVTGITYNLSVYWKGQLYTASETQPVKVPLDTITYQFNEAGAFQEEGYLCAVNAQDPIGQSNYYRFKFYRNDTLQTDPFKYFVVDDAFVEDNYIIAFTPYVYQTNDTCRIEVLSITNPYFKFLTALGDQVQASGGPFDPIPSNPPSNISNGALGFFAVAGYSSKEIVLP